MAGSQAASCANAVEIVAAARVVAVDVDLVVVEQVGERGCARYIRHLIEHGAGAR